MIAKVRIRGRCNFIIFIATPSVPLASTLPAAVRALPLDTLPPSGSLPLALLALHCALTTQSTVYEYDAENRLIRVASLDKTVNYKYDGLGRRIEKEVTETAVTNVTQYIYDNEDILLELDGSNNITARYTHGPGIDEPLITERGGQSFFYHADGLGSITELTDTAGTIAQSYTYSSFGEIESQLDPVFVQPYTFTAREFDPETGLFHYRARAYDPSIGRFLQEDPIGFSGGINFHTYVQNNPINLVDPNGQIGVAGVVVTVIVVGLIVKAGIEFRDLLRAAEPGIQANARRNEILSKRAFDPDIVSTSLERRDAFLEFKPHIRKTARTIPGTTLTGPPPTTQSETILSGIMMLIGLICDDDKEKEEN